MVGRGIQKTVRHSISIFGKRKFDKIISENKEMCVLL